MSTEITGVNSGEVTAIARADNNQEPTALDRSRQPEYDPYAEIATNLWNGEIAQRVQGIIEALGLFTKSEISPILQARAFFKAHRKIAPKYFDEKIYNQNTYDRLVTQAFRKIIDPKFQEWVGSEHISMMTGDGWNVTFQLGLLAGESGPRIELNCGGPQNLSHWGLEPTDENFEIRLGSFYGSNQLFTYEENYNLRPGYGIIETQQTVMIDNRNSIQVQVTVFPRPFVSMWGDKSKEYALEQKIELNRKLLTTCSYSHLTPEGQVMLDEVFILDPDQTNQHGSQRWFGHYNRATNTLEWQSDMDRANVAKEPGFFRKLGNKIFGGKKSGASERGPRNVTVTIDQETNQVIFSISGGEITRIPITRNVLDSVPSFQNMAGNLSGTPKAPQLPDS